MPVSADYLSKYLTASSSKKSAGAGDFEDSTRPKKRRKKDRSNNGVVIDDDEDLLLSNQKTRDDDDDAPLVFEGKIKGTEFRKKKASAWQAVNNGEKQAGNDEADTILSQAVAESRQRQEAIDQDDAPAIVEADSDSEPKMTSGARAGLQTAQDSAAMLARQTEREQAESKRRKKRKDEEPEAETVYRDATGRRIDISLRRAEARAAEQEKAAAEKKRRDEAMGDVQLQQRQQARQELEDAAFMPLARGADDEKLNEQQKEELRWEDPMAAYIARERAKEDVESGRDRESSGQQKLQKAKSKEYTGAAAPNRYGIKPGWRWDGVDRSNGFEKEWFQARGKKQRNENLEYQWQMDG